MTAIWRGVFWLAMAFNLAAGLPLLFAPGFLLTQLGASVPDDLVFYRLAGLLIALFGVVYGFIANDLQRYRPLVWLAVFGKFAVGAIFFQAWSAGLVPLKPVLLAGGDIAFGLVFLVFMLTYPKQA